MALAAGAAAEVTVLVSARGTGRLGAPAVSQTAKPVLTCILLKLNAGFKRGLSSAPVVVPGG